MNIVQSSTNHLALYKGASFSTDNPSEACDHLSNYLCSHEIKMQDLQQLSFRHCRAEVGHIGIHALQYGVELTIDGYVDEDAYIILLLTQGNGKLTQNDTTQKASPNNVVVVNPGRMMSLALSADESNLTLRIPTRLVNEFIQRETGFTPSSPVEFEPNFDRFGKGLRRFIGYLCSELDRNSPALASRLICQQMEQTIISLILSELSHDHQHLLATPADTVQKPVHVQAANSFIAENAHLGITVEDIAKAANVSIRTLQKSFQKYCNTTPTTALRSYRLKAARTCLLRANPLQDSVTEIAYNCGFSHLSRFTLQYKALFGETPSNTLKKSFL